MTGFLTENSVEIGIFIGVMFILGVLKAWLRSTRVNDIVYGYSRYSDHSGNKKKTKLQINTQIRYKMNNKEDLKELGHKEGYFFRSSISYANEYFILVEVNNTDNSAFVNIYKLVSLEDEDIVSGETILKNVDTSDMSFICKLHLYGKYFFPKFSKDLQFYYEEANEDNTYSSGDIDSLHEVMNFALNIGLKISKIIPR